MNFFYKSSLFATCLLISISSFSSDDLQINTIKEIYQLGKKLQQGNTLLQAYYDENLESAFDNLREENAEDCPHIWYDLMWQSNDNEYNQKPSFTKVGQNLVRVKLAAYGNYSSKSVTYRLSCKSGVCKISDIIDTNGSLKNQLVMQCQ